jgi:hypothetical protein
VWRWPDDGVFSRDLIDLAMTDPPAVVWQRVRRLARILPPDPVARG